MSAKHGLANSQGFEFTLCGIAYDAFESGDADEKVTFAKSGERVTCEECREVIDHIRKFQGYRQP